MKSASFIQITKSEFPNLVTKQQARKSQVEGVRVMAQWL